MSNTTKDDDALDALDAEIEQLEAGLLAAQRKAGDLGGDDEESAIAEAAAKALEWRLGERLRYAQRLNRAFRKSRCHAHGDALRVTCPECQVAWRYQPSKVA